jgi:hypothetical protein
VRHDSLLNPAKSAVRRGDSRAVQFIPCRVGKFARAERGQRVEFGSAQKGDHGAADSAPIK